MPGFQPSNAFIRKAEEVCVISVPFLFLNNYPKISLPRRKALLLFTCIVIMRKIECFFAHYIYCCFVILLFLWRLAVGCRLLFSSKNLSVLEEKVGVGAFVTPRRCLGPNYARLSAFKCFYPQGGRSLRHQRAIHLFKQLNN